MSQDATNGERKPRYRDERDRRVAGLNGYERVRELGRRSDPGDIFGHAGVRR